MVIQVDDEIRTKIIGTRVDANDIVSLFLFIYNMSCVLSFSMVARFPIFCAHNLQILCINFPRFADDLHVFDLSIIDVLRFVYKRCR